MHAGIIKFAALSDHNWTGADQQDFFKLVISRHLRSADTKRNREKFTRESQLGVSSPASLRHLCHTLPVEPNFADAFDACEHIIDRLTADTHQLCANDAPDEITREIEDFLWCRAFESFAKNRCHGAGKRLHFRTERHANVCSAVFIHVQINADCVCAFLVFPHIDKIKVFSLARLLVLRVVRVGNKSFAPLILGEHLKEVNDLV